MIKKAFFFLVLFTVMQMQSAFAVYFGTIDYFQPWEYLEKIKKDSQHPAHKSIKKVNNAIQATVFLPKKGTGVLISPDGLIVTAAHVIAHAYIGAVDRCPRLNFHLNHEKNSDGEFIEHTYLECEKVLVYDYAHDFALIKVKKPESINKLPFVKMAHLPDGPKEDSWAFILGHPKANSWNASAKVVSEGPIVYNGRDIKELPHFLHLIDTEGGHSGSPVFNKKAQLVGVHFRGIPHYGTGVKGRLNGKVQKFHTFNVAIDMGFLYHEYKELFDQFLP